MASDKNNETTLAQIDINNEMHDITSNNKDIEIHLRSQRKLSV